MCQSVRQSILMQSQTHNQGRWQHKQPWEGGGGRVNSLNRGTFHRHRCWSKIADRWGALAYIEVMRLLAVGYGWGGEQFCNASFLCCRNSPL